MTCDLMTCLALITFYSCPGNKCPESVFHSVFYELMVVIVLLLLLLLLLLFFYIRVSRHADYQLICNYSVAAVKYPLRSKAPRHSTHVQTTNTPTPVHTPSLFSKSPSCKSKEVETVSVVERCFLSQVFARLVLWRRLVVFFRSDRSVGCKTGVLNFNLAATK